MGKYLFQYHEVFPTTWVYLSSLLMVGLFFKFGRFWSVRNLDLLLLVLLAPGLLLVYFGLEMRRPGVDISGAVFGSAPVDADMPDDASDNVPGDGGETVSTPDADTGERDDTESTVPTDSESAGDDRTAAEVEAAHDSAEADGPPQEVPGAMEDAEPELDPRSLLPAVVPPPVPPKLPEAGEVSRLGYLWLFVAGLVIIIRLLLDSTMVRRPLLEPNLSVGGMAFIGGSLFVFLMAAVIASQPSVSNAELRVARQHAVPGVEEAKLEDPFARQGPGLRMLNVLPTIPTMSLLDREHRLPQQTRRKIEHATTAKTMAVLAHLAIVVGIALVGYRHFGNIHTGVGMATLYLMLPYTAMMTGRVTHVVPAALLVWAVFSYRRPIFSGMFIGLVIGVIYYPLFLLPLWVSFYWQRGLYRFLAGLASMLVLVVLFVVFTAEDALSQIREMFGLWKPVMDGLGGLWDLDAGGWDPFYRITVLAAFIALSFGLALWPPQKNLGTLIACSGAIMVGTQFWHGHGGGIFVGWYLPLLVLTVFRPNLEDRIAMGVIGQAQSPWGEQPPAQSSP